ncbi:hypothetical protein Pmani_011390 [Petrolisthes manimaculis]|uniref:Uncharacterized protein n=1 Tax=Petrolisthes manimaculis TaxID=1843537 RepID=A0AAE1Q0U7_9EUCA|nr:hypothetical protein Pmani_011390 [Petrolisthes manimaculis]
MFCTLLFFNLPGLTFTIPIKCHEDKLPYFPDHRTINDGHRIVALEYAMDLLQPTTTYANKSIFAIAVKNVSDNSKIANMMITHDRTMEEVERDVVAKKQQQQHEFHVE